MASHGLLLCILGMIAVNCLHQTFGEKYLDQCDSEKCFGIKLEDCKPTAKPESATRYSFNDKKFECEETTKCHKGIFDEDDRASYLFDKLDDCKTACSFCKTLTTVHKYKPEDPCLLANIQIKGDDNKEQKPRTYWHFTQQLGKCTQETRNLAEGFQATKGIIFKSKEDCDKRCPTIPIPPKP